MLSEICVKTEYILSLLEGGEDGEEINISKLSNHTKYDSRRVKEIFDSLEAAGFLEQIDKKKYKYRGIDGMRKQFRILQCKKSPIKSNSHKSPKGIYYICQYILFLFLGSGKTEIPVNNIIRMCLIDDARKRNGRKILYNSVMLIANILSTPGVNIFEVKDRGFDPCLALNSIFSETPPKHKKSCRYMFPGELGESLMDNETAKDEELSVRISKYLSPEYQSEKQAEEQQEIQMETFTDDEVTDH